MSKLIRLYPYNPRRGWLIQTYLDPGLGERGLKFRGSRGWYEVWDEVAEVLKDVRQKDNDPRSGPAFMIADDAKHAEVLEAELRDPDEEDASVGTADAPVRPGKRKAKAKGTPRTRQRKTKAS